jgi:hypothetical protein
VEIARRASAGEDIFDEEDESTMLEHLETIDLSRSNHVNEVNLHILESVASAELSGMFSYAGGNSSESREEPERHELVEDKHPVQEHQWQKSYETRKDRWKKSVSLQDPPATVEGSSKDQNALDLLQDGSGFRSMDYQDVAAIHSGNPNVPESTTEPADTVLSIDDVIAEYTLNTEQSRALRLIAEHSLEKGDQPLRMFLGGPGGTGKSRVLNALTDFFRRRSQERRFRLASYTGDAARNISGMTLHAAPNLGQKSKFGLNSKARRDLMSMWEGVGYLLIDEVSTTGCALPNDISKALSIAKGNTDAFGGINIIFAGDFSQLPPVGQKRLYANIITPGALYNADTGPKQNIVSGKLLWLSVKTVEPFSVNRAGEDDIQQVSYVAGE